MNITRKEVAQWKDVKLAAKLAWDAACVEAGVPTDSKFVVFDYNLPAAKAANQAALEVVKTRNRITRNASRRERHQAMKDLGLKRVVAYLHR